MNTDYLCERRLSELNPHYHTLVKNTAFLMSYTLEKYRTYFPDFTDHTILHSMQVLDFCNRLLGEQAEQLNEDELYILIMSAYLHDSGMGISESDYKALHDTVVSEKYRLSHPVENIPETIRGFHQKFSRQFICKYADLFEIPSPEHVQAIALVSEAHRNMDLFDEAVLPAVTVMPNGNEVHVPFLATLIRLADEMDIAADRNIALSPDSQDTIFKMMHRSIRRLHILPDRFVLDVRQDDPALYDGITKEIEKLAETLESCSRAAERRTPFRIRQKQVIINRIPEESEHIVVLDSDLGTDDACALLLMKNLPVKPDYLVASYGNTSLSGACRNAVILKKALGLNATVVRGMEPPEKPGLPLAEKNTFHGKDGLADCGEELLRELRITPDEINGVMPFETFKREILAHDAITYVTIGTLTNFAHLLEDPVFRGKLRGAYIMGGGIGEYNCSHDTEFNFSKDPGSVGKILSSGLNITLFPLDVTNHQVLNDREIDGLETIGTYPAFIRFLRHNRKANAAYNDIPAAVLHDALPVLYLSHPEMFRLEDMRIVSDEYGHISPSARGEAIHVCTGMKEGSLLACMEAAFRG